MVFEIWNLFCENIVFQQNTNLDLSSIFYNKQICNKNVTENARVCFSDILVNKSWIPCLVLRERKSSLSILTSYRLNLWKGFLAAAFSVRKKRRFVLWNTNNQVLEGRRRDATSKGLIYKSDSAQYEGIPRLFSHNGQFISALAYPFFAGVLQPREELGRGADFSNYISKWFS